MACRFPRESLVCPDCRVGLSGETPALRCNACGGEFSERDGTLCLWPPSRRESIQESLKHFSEPHGGLRRNTFLRALVPPNSVYDPFESERTERVKKLFGPVVVNLGAKSSRWGEKILNADLVAPAGTALDALIDLHRLPFADGSLDGVICTYVLEHVADANTCLAEIARVLKPGGLAYVSVPFLFPTHPDPLDRARWTLDGLCAAMPDFEKIEAGPCGGPFSTLVSVQPTALGSVFSNFALYNTVRFALGWLMWPLKFLDHFAARSSRAYMAAPAFYFLGKKRAAKT